MKKTKKSKLIRIHTYLYNKYFVSHPLLFRQKKAKKLIESTHTTHIENERERWIVEEDDFCVLSSVYVVRYTLYV